MWKIWIISFVEQNNFLVFHAGLDNVWLTSDLNDHWSALEKVIYHGRTERKTYAVKNMQEGEIKQFQVDNLKFMPNDYLGHSDFLPPTYDIF